jgi:hypothetical protein
MAITEWQNIAVKLSAISGKTNKKINIITYQKLNYYKKNIYFRSNTCMLTGKQDLN